MKTFASMEEARELHLYAQNNENVYMQSLSPIMDNMDAKRARGIFDKEKAVKAFEYAAEYAARRYCQDFGGLWCQVFNVATRRAAAALLLDDYLSDVL